MITAAQRDLATDAAANLRALADLIDESVGNDPDVRKEARRVLRRKVEYGASLQHDRLTSIPIHGPYLSVLWETCPGCQSEALQPGETLCWECADETAEQTAAEPCATGGAA